MPLLVFPPSTKHAFAGGLFVDPGYNAAVSTAFETGRIPRFETIRSARELGAASLRASYVCAARGLSRAIDEEDAGQGRVSRVRSALLANVLGEVERIVDDIPVDMDDDTGASKAWGEIARGEATAVRRELQKHRPLTDTAAQRPFLMLSVYAENAAWAALDHVRAWEQAQFLARPPVYVWRSHFWRRVDPWHFTLPWMDFAMLYSSACFMGFNAVVLRRDEDMEAAAEKVFRKFLRAEKIPVDGYHLPPDMCPQVLHAFAHFVWAVYLDHGMAWENGSGRVLKGPEAILMGLRRELEERVLKTEEPSLAPLGRLVDQCAHFAIAYATLVASLKNIRFMAVPGAWIHLFRLRWATSQFLAKWALAFTAGRILYLPSAADALYARADYVLGLAKRLHGTFQSAHRSTAFEAVADASLTEGQVREEVAFLEDRRAASGAPPGGDRATEIAEVFVRALKEMPEQRGCARCIDPQVVANAVFRLP